MENKMRFTTPEELSRSPDAQEMRRRLKDADERKLLRAETREHVREWYPDLARMLQLDPTEEAALIDVLTDQQMEHLERFWFQMPSGPWPANVEHTDRTQWLADDETRKLTQLKEVIGEERFHRYLQYQSTWGARRQATYFNARLDPDQKLSQEQKERLIALLHKEDEANREEERARRVRRSLELMPRLPPAEDEMRKRNVELNEEGLRQMEKASRQRLKKLPSVLTPEQLDVYAKMEAETLAAQRKYVQEMRVSAGMSPEIPEVVEEPAQAQPVLHEPVAGRIRFDMQLWVNRNEPVDLSLEMQNSEVTSFEAPEGLWIEVRPTLYAHGWLHVDLAFYERGPDGHRRLIHKSDMGTRTRPDARLAGGGGNVVRGSKGYAIRTLANARSSTC